MIIKNYKELNKLFKEFNKFYETVVKIVPNTQYTERLVNGDSLLVADAKVDGINIAFSYDKQNPTYVTEGKSGPYLVMVWTPSYKVLLKNISNGNVSKMFRDDVFRSMVFHEFVHLKDGMVKGFSNLKEVTGEPKDLCTYCKQSPDELVAVTYQTLYDAVYLNGITVVGIPPRLVVEEVKNRGVKYSSADIETLIDCPKVGDLYVELLLTAVK